MKQTTMQKLILGVLLTVLSGIAGYAEDSRPASKKLRIYTAGNSFHMWLPNWLTPIENVAKITPHEQVGVSYMASAYVRQHLTQIDDKHQAKPVVESGNFDVLTLCGMHTGDDGIDQFATIGREHNPKLIVTYQEFWLPFDRLEYPLTRKNTFGDLAKSLRTWEDIPLDTKDPKLVAQNTANFNIPNADQLDKLHEPYFEGINKYVGDLNKKLGGDVVRIVPVGQAVLALRRKVIAGGVPGITKQSELFQDNLGHPGDAIRALAGYCHFIVIYHSDPRGLPLPLFPFSRNGKFTQECNLILENLAWKAVTEHPLSGFYQGKPN
jgi:hypothetical protein